MYCFQIRETSLLDVNYDLRLNYINQGQQKPGGQGAHSELLKRTMHSLGILAFYESDDPLCPKA